MKRRLHIAIAAFAMVGLMFSCSTSNDVASNRKIQKRKYTKGFYIDSDRKVRGNGQQEDVVSTEVVPEEVTPVAVETAAVERKTVEKEVVYVEDNATEIVNPIRHLLAEEVEAPTTSVATTPEVEKIGFEKSKKEDFKVIGSDIKFIKEDVRKLRKTQMKSDNASEDAILYYILAILIPFLAVGLVTDWDLTKVIICLLLCFLFWLPGMIYALIVVSQNV